MIGGISIWQLLILLVIVILVFGTKRLRNLGGDLGSALRDFRGAMKDNDESDQDKKNTDTRADDARLVDDVDQPKHKTGPVEAEQQRRTETNAAQSNATDARSTDKHD